MIDQVVYWLDATINNTIVGDVANIVVHAFDSKTFATPMSEELTSYYKNYKIILPITTSE